MCAMPTKWKLENTQTLDQKFAMTRLPSYHTIYEYRVPSWRLYLQETDLTKSFDKKPIISKVLGTLFKN